MRLFTFVCWLGIVILYFTSCNKETDLYHYQIANDYCDEMYDFRSTPYSSPYMGTLQTGCTFPQNQIYPERYSYWFPCANPTNDYEICYCRIENGFQTIDNMDLFTYNFCSGKSTLIAYNVRGWPDWSIKNWIVFSGTDANLWKIKSNGDSLKRLTSSGGFFRAIWSPNGDQFIRNGDGLSESNGNYIKQLPIHFSSCTWTNDSVLVGGIESSDGKMFKLYGQNIISDDSKLLINIPISGTGNIESLKNNIAYISASDPNNNGNVNYYSFNLLTLDTVKLQTLPQSFIQRWRIINSGKIILQQILRDTMTGDICKLNYRSHLAIMDLDRKNERQILLPD